MSRNVNSFFSENPASLDISRSRFERGQSHKTTFNVGDLIPFYLDEVLPGDTMSIDTSKVVRLSTLVSPIMDNIYLDTYFFFVPNRLVWNHWKEFMGENTQSAWIPQVSYSIPQIECPVNGWDKGSIADYFGIPTEVDNISVNAIPLRAYALICNEWFRDENLTDPIYINTGDNTSTGRRADDAQTTYRVGCALGGAPFKVAKYHDYFTSALPAPQKGPDVLVPVGNFAPVRTAFNDIDVDANSPGMHFKDAVSGTKITGLHALAISESGDNTILRNSTAQSSATMGEYPIPSNLYADLGRATGSSINQLRQAFQIQKLYEKDARGGK